jgi:parallel beta-helix repeat protein
MALTKVSYSMIAGANVNVIDFGAVGDGTTDDAAAIQAAIDSISEGVVEFPAGTFVVNTNIVLKSNVSLKGNGTTLSPKTYWANGAALLYGNADTNITIEGFTFDGNGVWTSTPFPNPYSAGNSVGFTNNQRGLDLNNNCSNIKIINNVFTGFGRAVQIFNCNDCIVSGNVIEDGGGAGVYCVNTEYSVISNNVIRGILGNITAAGNTDIQTSIYADGVYLDNSSKITVSNNVIEDCIRIGVVLEGAVLALSDNITVTGNTIRNMNSCRGTEYNAGIWSEPNHVGTNCTFSSNVIDNQGATAGVNPSYGIYISSKNLAVGNTIKYFNVGIVGTEFSAIGNTVQYCGSTSQPAIQVAYQAAGLSTTIKDNIVQKNNGVGISVFQSHGLIVVKGNVINDNGQTSNLTTSPNSCVGVQINRHYNDQTVVIDANTFLSSASQSTTNRQLFAIMSIAGGDYSATQNYFTNNQFVFTGTFTDVYPTTIGITPCSYAYDNTSGTISKYEVGSTWSNWNSKLINANPIVSTVAGVVNFCGYASAAPVSGSYKAGDYFYTTTATAGSFIGFVCTTAGTPGTWKTFGAISA